MVIDSELTRRATDRYVARALQFPDVTAAPAARDPRHARPGMGSAPLGEFSGNLLPPRNARGAEGVNRFWTRIQTNSGMGVGHPHRPGLPADALASRGADAAAETRDPRASAGRSTALGSAEHPSFGVGAAGQSGVAIGRLIPA